VLLWGQKTGSKPGQPANYFKQTSFLSLYNSLGSRGVEKRVGGGGKPQSCLVFQSLFRRGFARLSLENIVYDLCGKVCVARGMGQGIVFCTLLIKIGATIFLFWPA